jgi:anti-anti-sigma regulatory factor
MNGSIRIDHKGKETVMHLYGEMTIIEMGMVRSAIIEAMHKADTLIIDLEGVEKADLTLLQTLCAAHRSATHVNKMFYHVGQYPSNVVETIHRLGFSRRKTCIAESKTPCFWQVGH